MLKVHAKKSNVAEVLCLEGQIVRGETEMLRSVVQLTSNTREIILDLSNVNVVDAHGLGVLLQLREQTHARGIHFELRNVSKPMYRLFEITRLNTVFDINCDVPYLPEFVYPLRALVAA